MKDIFTIIIRLTVSCLLAGVIMGATFVFTHKAKVHNAEVNEQKVMLRLLGYSQAHPAPASLKLHPIYRYIVTANGVSTIGYLVPTKEQGGADFVFVNIDLDGNFIAKMPVQLTAEKSSEQGSRDAAVSAALGGGKEAHYVDRTIVVSENGVRKAYLLPGEFPGFKTFVKVILSLDPKFTITGLEIMEDEEDPGLGGEISEDYFKNQFRGKTFADLKKLGVIKVPLPEDYRRVLENDKNGGKISEAEVDKVEAAYADKDIYALTGATISSRAVTNGVKGLVNKFAYRTGILDRVLKEQQVAVPF